VNFYRHHIGDYAQATAHLSFVEDAAYIRLLRKYYAEERALPADVKAAQRIVGARTKDEREAVDTVLNEFFALEVDGWHNKRADAEIEAYNAKAERNREVGKKGGRPITVKDNSGNPNGFHKETQTVSRNNPSHKPLASSQEPEEPQSESPTGDLLGSTVVDLRHATPECPQQAIVALYHEGLPSLRQMREWTGDRQKWLRSRWRESRERQELGWWRDLFAYIARSDFLMGRTPGRNDLPFDCDLDWIVRASNLRKIIEGKYENKREAASKTAVFDRATSGAAA
jgi:uncharacterized protein YdaU (DUF1376 family)